MFISAIERVTGFTRPIHTIFRTFGSEEIIPGAATLFFVNETGTAVTCKHVVESLLTADRINKNFRDYLQELQHLQKSNATTEQIEALQRKFSYSTTSPIQIKNNFVDCFGGISGFSAHIHPSLDLAIIQFEGIKDIRYKDCARFVKDPSDIKQGKYLCRLGFPFPEFNNFRFNNENNDIEWTSQGNQLSPWFPIEGMVTRFIADQNGLFGIEMSTPGLRGQSGGPLFDDRGRICGMQFATRHFHLGFDLVDKEILVNNSKQKISDFSFLHLGQCIHAEAIKQFLRQHNVVFYEEN